MQNAHWPVERERRKKNYSKYAHIQKARLLGWLAGCVTHEINFRACYFRERFYRCYVADCVCVCMFSFLLLYFFFSPYSFILFLFLFSMFRFFFCFVSFLLLALVRAFKFSCHPIYIYLYIYYIYACIYLPRFVALV